MGKSANGKSGAGVKNRAGVTGEKQRGRESHGEASFNFDNLYPPEYLSWMGLGDGASGQFGWWSNKPSDSFVRARSLSQVPFIQMLGQVNRAFYNHGLTIKPAKPSAHSQKKLDAWLQGDVKPEGSFGQMTGEQMVRALANRAWWERIIASNVIVGWHAWNREPQILLAEHCELKEWILGLQLYWSHGWSGEYIRQLKEWLVSAGTLSQMEVDEWGRRFEGGIVRLHDVEWNRKHPGAADYARVLTHQDGERVLSKPSLQGVFFAADQYQSMELGEAGFAFLGRNPMEKITLGYEPKGDAARVTTGLMQVSTKRMNNVKLDAQKANGPHKTVVPFDHKVERIWLETDRFDPEKWQSPMERFAIWAGPLGAMFLGQKPNPENLTILKAMLDMERPRMAAFLEPVISHFAPVPIQLSWSNECLYSPQQVMDILQDLGVMGAVSLRSIVDLFGPERFEVELDRKREEVALSKSEPDIFKPAYDPHHGEVSKGSGDPRQKKSGRPQGSGAADGQ